MKIKCLLLSCVLSTGVFSQDDFRFSNSSYLQQLEAEKQAQIESEKSNLFSDYNLSKLKGKLTVDQYKNIINTQLRKIELEHYKGNRKGHEARIITIDTRNKEACRKVEADLIHKKHITAEDKICEYNPSKPFVSVVSMDKMQTEYRTYIKDIIPSRDDNDALYDIKKQTRNFLGLGVVSMGVLFALPESVSNWDREEIINEFGNKWVDNVKQGPVVDEDAWYINYIGHPVSGAAYHMVARHAGLSAWQSFGYSVFMSTFFWEYGLEALAEVPSLQDLILTPVIGSILGEMFYALEKRIIKNKGYLLDSKNLGTVMTYLMDPAAPLLNLVNNLFEAEIVKNADFYIYARRRQPYNSLIPSMIFQSENEVGIGIELKF